MSGTFTLDEMTISLRYSIRIGNEIDACFWASRLDMAMDHGPLWDSLNISCIEDIGIGNINTIREVKENNIMWCEHLKNKGLFKHEFHLSKTCQDIIMKTIIFLCRSKKSMVVSTALDWMGRNYKGSIENEDRQINDVMLYLCSDEMSNGLCPNRVKVCASNFVEYLTKRDIKNAMKYGMTLYLWKRKENEEPCKFDVIFPDTRRVAWDIVISESTNLSDVLMETLELCHELWKSCERKIYLAFAIILICSKKFDHSVPGYIDDDTLNNMACLSYSSTEIGHPIPKNRSLVTVNNLFGDDDPFYSTESVIQLDSSSSVFNTTIRRIRSENVIIQKRKREEEPVVISKKANRTIKERLEDGNISLGIYLGLICV